MAFGFLNSKTEEYESEEKEKETEIGKKGEHERQSKYVNGLDWIGFDFDASITIVVEHKSISGRKESRYSQPNGLSFQMKWLGNFLCHNSLDNLNFWVIGI